MMKLKSLFGPQNECRASGSAALLPVIISEFCALGGNAIDIGSLVAHHAHVVRRQIPKTDVISPDDQHIRLVLSERRSGKKHADDDEKNPHRGDTYYCLSRDRLLAACWDGDCLKGIYLVLVRQLGGSWLVALQSDMCDKPLGLKKDLS